MQTADDPTRVDEEDDTPAALQAVKYRALRADLAAVLARFEKANDWADYASQLGEVRRCLQRHAQHSFVPEKHVLAKWLAHCLYAGFPTGLHLKALDVYEMVFKRIGQQRLARDLPLYAAGLFPLLSYCAMSVRPRLLEIYAKYIVTLGTAGDGDANTAAATVKRRKKKSAIASSMNKALASLKLTRKHHGTEAGARSTVASEEAGTGAAPKSGAEAAALLDADANTENAAARSTGPEAVAQEDTAAAAAASANLVEFSDSSDEEPDAERVWAGADTAADDALSSPAASRPLSFLLDGIVRSLLPGLDESGSTEADTAVVSKVLDLLNAVRQNVASDAAFCAAIWRAMLDFETDKLMLTQYGVALVQSGAGWRMAYSDWRSTASSASGSEAHGVSVLSASAERAAAGSGAAGGDAAAPSSEYSAVSRLRLQALVYLLFLSEEARDARRPRSPQRVSLASLFFDTALVTRALSAVLEDRNALVLRHALDLVVSTFGFGVGRAGDAEQAAAGDGAPTGMQVKDAPIRLPAAQSVVLMQRTLRTLLRRDLSLNKRVHQFLELPGCEPLVMRALEQEWRAAGAVPLTRAVFGASTDDRGDAVATRTDGRSDDNAAAPFPSVGGSDAVTGLRVFLAVAQRPSLASRLGWEFVASATRLAHALLGAGDTAWADERPSTAETEAVATALFVDLAEAAAPSAGTSLPPPPSPAAETTAVTRELYDALGRGAIWRALAATLEQLRACSQPIRTLAPLSSYVAFVVDEVGVSADVAWTDVLQVLSACIELCGRACGTAPTASWYGVAAVWAPALSTLARTAASVRRLSLDATAARDCAERMQQLLEAMVNQLWQPWARAVSSATDEGGDATTTADAPRFGSPPWLAAQAEATSDALAEWVRAVLIGPQSLSGAAARAAVRQALHCTRQLCLSREAPVSIHGLELYLDVVDLCALPAPAQAALAAELTPPAEREQVLGRCWRLLHPVLPSCTPRLAALWYSMQQLYPVECRDLVADRLLLGAVDERVAAMDTFRAVFRHARELQLSQSLPSACTLLVLDGLASDNTAVKEAAARFVDESLVLAPERVIGPLLGLVLHESFPLQNERLEFVIRPDLPRVTYALQTLAAVLRACRKPSAGARPTPPTLQLRTDEQLFRALQQPPSAPIAAAVTALGGPEDLVSDGDYLDACAFAALWYMRARWSAAAARQMLLYDEGEEAAEEVDGEEGALYRAFISARHAATDLVLAVLEVAASEAHGNRAMALCNDLTKPLLAVMAAGGGREQPEAGSDASAEGAVDRHDATVRLLLARALQMMISVHGGYFVEQRPPRHGDGSASGSPARTGLANAEALPDGAHSVSTATGERRSKRSGGRKSHKSSRKPWSISATWMKLGSGRPANAHATSSGTHPSS